MAAAALLAGCGYSGLPRPEVDNFNIEDIPRVAYRWEPHAQQAVATTLIVTGGHQTVGDIMTEGSWIMVIEHLLGRNNRVIAIEASAPNYYLNPSEEWTPIS